MRRVLPLLVVGPVLAAAGFYAATFASVVIAQLLFLAALLLLLPRWFGVRVGLRVFSKLVA